MQARGTRRAESGDGLQGAEGPRRVLLPNVRCLPLSCNRPSRIRPLPVPCGVPNMPQSRRTDRLNEQLRQEITLLVRDEVRDPRVGLATITAVQTSPELDHARVYFTTLGDAD